MALGMVVLTGCRPPGYKLNKLVTLWRKDKIPYGTYYAYENLKFIFPDSRISINEESPASFAFDSSSEQSYKDIVSETPHKKAYIIVAPSVMPDQSEWNAIMDFVGRGNHVFISSMYFSDSLLSSVKIKLNSGIFFNDSLRVSVNNPVTNDSLSFQYPGDGTNSYAISIDSQYTTVLGRDQAGHPNFVRFTYKGGGSLYLHFVPLALSNFFLLHKDNHAYYENVFSYLPASVREVKWDDYFRYHKRRDFSTLQYILSYRDSNGNAPLAWGFWLLLTVLLLIYLFDSKRRQRIVPEITPLRNSSLDFVKTIGRLYYQRKDNYNLALKIVAHFLDHVRVKYNLQTTVLDNEFTDKLSYKSGVPKKQLEDIVESVRDIQLGGIISDEYLLAFNNKMEEFYRQG
jgi:hypothetical protein